MAAVADAIKRRGTPAESIAFFPAHANGPGPEASAETRRRWAITRCYVVSPESLRWCGLDLRGVLAARSARLLGAPATSPAQVFDLSAAAWRDQAIADRSAWPAAMPPFEVVKHRCAIGPSSVVWRFAGTRERALTEVVARHAERGLGPALLGREHGFIATRWIDGEPMRPGDASHGVVDAIARHMGGTAGAALDAIEAAAALDRLREVCVINVGEALGRDAASAAARLAAQVRATARRCAPRRCGDAHPWPHAWVRDPEGRVWKVGGGWHEDDHTLIGPQPLAWGVAGLLVEWRFDSAHEVALLGALATVDATLAERAFLQFHVLAYAAFRLGQVVLCSASVGADDRGRITAAADRYRDVIAASLN
jgi:hypothetical protein